MCTLLYTAIENVHDHRFTQNITVTLDAFIVKKLQVVLKYKTESEYIELNYVGS